MGNKGVPKDPLNYSESCSTGACTVHIRLTRLHSSTFFYIPHYSIIYRTIIHKATAACSCLMHRFSGVVKSKKCGCGVLHDWRGKVTTGRRWLVANIILFFPPHSRTRKSIWGHSVSENSGKGNRPIRSQHAFFRADDWAKQRFSMTNTSARSIGDLCPRNQAVLILSAAICRDSCSDEVDSGTLRVLNSSVTMASRAKSRLV